MRPRRRWLRIDAGQPNFDALSGDRMSAVTVVVQVVEQDVLIGENDPGGFPRRYQHLVGEGAGVVYVNGRGHDVRWSRGAPGDVTTWTYADSGEPVVLPPGRGLVGDRAGKEVRHQRGLRQTSWSVADGRSSSRSGRTGRHPWRAGSGDRGRTSGWRSMRRRTSCVRIVDLVVPRAVASGTGSARADRNGAILRRRGQRHPWATRSSAAGVGRRHRGAREPDRPGGSAASTVGRRRARSAGRGRGLPLIWFLPSRLAWYIARSAADISSSADRPSSGCDETDADAGHRLGAGIAMPTSSAPTRIFSATTKAPTISVSGRRTTNSSPPYR